MKKILFLPVLFFVFNSCIKEFDLNLNKSEKLLVVDGLITNGNGPYFVRLTRSSGKLNTTYILPPNWDFENSFKDSAEVVTNATVIISDNLGNSDTLIKVPQYYAGYVQFYNSNTHVLDSVYDPHIEERYGINKGFYRTSHIQGVAGRNYNLLVVVDGKEYRSHCFMPPLPKIDSISYEIKKSEIKGDEYYSPIIYFNKLSDTDYYLFRFQANPDVHDTRTNTIFPTINSISNWDFSIISTKFLKPEINGLDIQLGNWVKPSNFQNYFWENEIHLTMNSLTKDSYAYYENLIGQLKNDGGAFKPTPSSPVGNISNGALGFFRASATIELRKKITP
jgi:hypothetical protein